MTVKSAWSKRRAAASGAVRRIDSRLRATKTAVRSLSVKEKGRTLPRWLGGGEGERGGVALVGLALRAAEEQQHRRRAAAAPLRRRLLVVVPLPHRAHRVRRVRAVQQHCHPRAAHRVVQDLRAAVPVGGAGLQPRSELRPDNEEL